MDDVLLPFSSSWVDLLDNNHENNFIFQISHQLEHIELEPWKFLSSSIWLVKRRNNKIHTHAIEQSIFFLLIEKSHMKTHWSIYLLSS